MIKLITSILFFVFVSIAGAVGVGDEAPDFTLNKVGGGTFQLSNHRGKIVYIFWFSYN